MKKIKSELWKNIEPPLPSLNGDKPNAYLWRNIASARKEDEKYKDIAIQGGFNPKWIEYIKDTFSTRNQAKIDLCRLTFAEGEYNLINSLLEIENKSFEEISTTQGEPLVEFHHRIREAVFSEEDAKAYIDISDWIKNQGEKAVNNYAAFLALFVFNGVLYEDFHSPFSQKAEAIKQLRNFKEKVFLPAWRKVVEITGKQPLIIHLPSKPELSWYSGKIKDKIKFSPREY
ncbi:MAG: hypothetical protein Q8N37_03060 [bacterium]|nr:hypothetical protein [bacterium]